MNTFPRNSDTKKVSLQPGVGFASCTLPQAGGAAVGDAALYKCMAHALFDNLAETPDELAFRRGDTLVVLEQNTGGLEGWWLCSLRGRQGICPGNRLRLLPGVYDTTAPAARLAAARLQHGSLGRHRRSWSPCHSQTSAIPGDRDLPRDGVDGRPPYTRQTSGDTYDSPPAPVSVVASLLPGQEEYDTPRPSRVLPPPAPITASCRPVPPPAAAKPQLGARTVLPTVPSGAEVLPPAHTPSVYSEPRSHQPAVDVYPAASNRCSGLSTTSAGSSVRSSSDSSSNRSSLEPASLSDSSASGARRPPQIPENGLYNTPRRPREHLYESPRFADGSTDDFCEDDGEEYDVPRNLGALPHTDGETYDVPAANLPVQAPTDLGDCYDVPPPTAPMGQPDLLGARRHREVTEYDSANDTLDTIDTSDTYDSALSVSQDIYDVPRSDQHVHGSLLGQQVHGSPLGQQSLQQHAVGQPSDLSSSIRGQETYDIPRPLMDVYDSPQSITCSPSHQSSRDSLISTGTSCRTSAISDSADESEVTLRTGRSRDLQSSRNATYWLRSAGGDSSSSLSGLGEPRELPLDTDAGLETIQRLEQELNATVSRLFSFVVPGWRSAEHMESCGVDLKLTVLRMRSALRELVQFAYGAMVATARGPEQQLGAQFVRVLKPLEESVRLIESAASQQDAAGWTVETMVRAQGAPADALDQLLACAQSLSGDARQLSAFMRGNAPLIFSRRLSGVTSPTSDVTDGSAGGPRAGLMGDYDYVCMGTQGSLDEEQDEVRSRLPEELRGSFDNLMKESQILVKTGRTGKVGSRGSQIDANDQQVLGFYREQTDSHHEFLNNAIDAFFATIQNNQPPKVFVAHSKFVILSAHKLVYIGDTVHRNVVNVTVRQGTLAASDALFASLKRTVQSTKTAALRFPSASAVQQMADAVLDVSRAAKKLKAVLDEETVP